MAMVDLLREYLSVYNPEQLNILFRGKMLDWFQTILYTLVTFTTSKCLYCFIPVSLVFTTYIQFCTHIVLL